MTPALAIALAATITGTAPAWKSDGCCCADTTRPSRVGAVVLYAVGQQAKAWRPGCERNAACWDSVRVQAAPVQEQSVGVVGGQRFSFVVPVDTLSRFVLSRWPMSDDPKGPWGEGRCWGKVVRP